MSNTSVGMVELPPQNSSTNLVNLIRLIRPHTPAMVVGLSLGVAGSFGTLAQPLAARSVLNSLASDGGASVIAIAVLGALVIGGAAATGLQMYIFERTGEHVVKTLRKHLGERLLRLKVAEYDRHQLGDLLSKAGSDTTFLRSVLTSSVMDAGPSLLTVIGAIILMAYLDWILFLVLMSVLTLAALVVMPALGRIRHSTHAAQAEVGSMTSSLERALGAIRTVKANLMEDYEVGVVSDRAERAYRAGIRVVKFDALATAAAGLGLQLSFLVVLGVGGYRVASDKLSAADLIAFILYVMYLSGPLALIMSSVTQLQKASAALSRILEVDSMPTEAAGPSSAMTTSSERPRHEEYATGRLPQPVRVSVDKVTFSYRPGIKNAVLSDVSFCIEPGTTTAVVGPSGCGKTTLLSLFERFYRPSEGSISLNGVDIADMTLSELRSQIGYVEQSAPILSGSLRENLTYGAPNTVSDSAISEALLATRLTDLVARLPDGLDSLVGERGSLLSGGERQRVACARLLLRRTGLVVLDEATSQLDAFNEEALHDALSKLAGKATVVIVAHRLATVVACENIVILNNGRVHAMGTHQELLQTNTMYRELARKQMIS